MTNEQIVDKLRDNGIYARCHAGGVLASLPTRWVSILEISKALDFKVSAEMFFRLGDKVMVKGIDSLLSSKKR